KWRARDGPHLACGPAKRLRGRRWDERCFLPAAPIGSLRRDMPESYSPLDRPMLARKRLEELLRAAAGRRVAIVGDAMLDVYLHGDVDRISPEAPVPVVR